MTATIDTTETQALTVLRSFMLSIIPTPFEVVRGLANRVAEPTSSDFATMTPLFKRRLSTNIVTYNDQIATGYRLSTQETEYTVQIDFHGPNSSDYAQIFTTLWRDDAAASFFETAMLTKNLGTGTQNITTDTGAFLVATYLINAAPLYCQDPRQMAFINGESQYEERWSVDAVMQLNPCITTVQQFAESLGPVGIVSVDAVYPP